MKNLFKYFENYFLSLIVKFFRKAKTKKKIPLDDDSKLLIIILRNNSEALLTTPLIRIIKKNSNAQISILTNLGNRNVFKNNSDIDQIYIAENTFSKILSHSKSLRQLDYDVLINSGEIYSEAEIIYSALLKAKYKIGFADIEDKIFSHLIQKPNPAVTHFVDRTLHLCDYFYFEVDKTNLNLNCSTTKDADDEIDRFLLSVFDSSKLLVIVNISSEINKNFWGVENYK
ncbi:MAG: glycosyltransferase family 9 protein, partial [Ignavibacteriae bacterium]|nr:glycosyltransferase family 9 protein [Ignavibacteriota bacterium]